MYLHYFNIFPDWLGTALIHLVGSVWVLRGNPLCCMASIISSWYFTGKYDFLLKQSVCQRLNCCSCISYLPMLLPKLMNLQWNGKTFRSLEWDLQILDNDYNLLIHLGYHICLYNYGILYAVSQQDYPCLISKVCYLNDSKQCYGCDWNYVCPWKTCFPACCHLWWPHQH